MYSLAIREGKTFITIPANGSPIDIEINPDVT